MTIQKLVSKARVLLTVVSCQVGFTEGNIRALCDVGRTTKKHTVGYIGQKGIGFKSVFKITDAPQIHSRGFHVSFDLVQHSALGYVLPTWVADADAAELASVSKLGSRQAVTTVVLPFKQVCVPPLKAKGWSVSLVLCLKLLQFVMFLTLLLLHERFTEGDKQQAGKAQSS